MALAGRVLGRPVVAIATGGASRAERRVVNRWLLVGLALTVVALPCRRLVGAIAGRLHDGVTVLIPCRRGSRATLVGGLWAAITGRGSRLLLLLTLHVLPLLLLNQGSAAAGTVLLIVIPLALQGADPLLQQRDLLLVVAALDFHLELELGNNQCQVVA